MNPVDLRNAIGRKSLDSVQPRISLLGNQTSGLQGSMPSKILVFNIHNAKYPITTQTLHKICINVAEVIRIVVIKVPGISSDTGPRDLVNPLQAMVEFSTIRDAINVKAAINGADVYDNCCTLDIEFAPANVSQLQVDWNDDVSWDIMLECQQARKTMAGKTLLPSYDGKQNRSIDGREKYGGHGDESFSSSRKRSYVKEEDSMSDHPSKYHRESYQRPYNRIEYSRKLEGPVVLVRNLDESIYLSEKATFLVFNIFSIYGNILRIKMLKTKPGMAMVEMETMEGVMKVMENLLGVQIQGKELQMKRSKQDCVNGSMNNDTNQKSSFWDFTGSTYNRFSSPLNPSLPIKVRRTHAPSKIIQFWNVVAFDNDEETERKIRENMEKENVTTPITIKFLKETKSPRNERLLLSGLMEFNSQVEGIEAMVFCNNLRIIPNQLQENEDKAGYSLKLSFSSLQVEIPGHLVRRSVSKDDADKSS